MRFRTFKDERGDDVHFNMDNVSLIMPHKDPTKHIVFFVGGQSITITAILAEIVAEITRP